MLDRRETTQRPRVHRRRLKSIAAIRLWLPVPINASQVAQFGRTIRLVDVRGVYAYDIRRRAAMLRRHVATLGAGIEGAQLKEADFNVPRRRQEFLSSYVGPPPASGRVLGEAR